MSLLMDIRYFLNGAATALVAFVLTACAHTYQSDADTSGDPAKGGTDTLMDIGKMDQTMGSYGSGREDRLILVTMENGIHSQLLSDIPDSASSLEETELPEPFRNFLADLKQRFDITRVADWPLGSIGVRCLVFENIGSRTNTDIALALQQESGVDSAQVVQLFSTSASGYNDPFVPMQHGFQTMRAEPSHRWTTGRDVLVGVIDTGIDQQHNDIQQSVTKVFDFVDKKNTGTSLDDHGTAVAGIISAAANNGTGMVGVAPDAKIIALKACWSRAQDKGATCNSFTLAKALNIAILNNVDIINLSLSGPRDRLLERLIRKAVDKNIIIVGARDPIDKNLFPAVLNEVIAAGLPGDTTLSTITAPGSQVISTAPGNQYDFYTGSSFSTAHLTGLVALLRQLEPTLNTEQIRQLLSEFTVAESIDACRLVTGLMKLDSTECSADTLQPEA
ncbi:MAG: S8 family serine peptidase [Granulosicoccus sp.]|nr:S8 family serine peptidase [Granulosicoccus sp.]